MIGEMQKHPAASACIIACFDDTGLDAARCLSAMPVIGIGEAAFHMASLIAGKFSVVTTLSRSVPAIEHNLVRYGLDSRCAKVRASDVPVLELEVPGSNARQRISEEIEHAILDDRAEAIVLGCAGMADLAAALSRDMAFRCSTASPAPSGFAKALSDSVFRPPNEVDTRSPGKNPSQGFLHLFRRAGRAADAYRQAHIGGRRRARRECRRMLAKSLTFAIRKVDVRASTETEASLPTAKGVRPPERNP